MVSEGIEYGPKDQFRAVLSCLRVLLEIFLFDAVIFSLFGSKEVEEADHHQLKLVKSVNSSLSTTRSLLGSSSQQARVRMARSYSAGKVYFMISGNIIFCT